MIIQNFSESEKNSYAHIVKSCPDYLKYNNMSSKKYSRLLPKELKLFNNLSWEIQRKMCYMTNSSNIQLLQFFWYLACSTQENGKKSWTYNHNSFQPFFSFKYVKQLEVQPYKLLSFKGDNQSKKKKKV